MPPILAIACTAREPTLRTRSQRRSSSEPSPLFIVRAHRTQYDDELVSAWKPPRRGKRRWPIMNGSDVQSGVSGFSGIQSSVHRPRCALTASTYSSSSIGRHAHSRVGVVGSLGVHVRSEKLDPCPPWSCRPSDPGEHLLSVVENRCWQGPAAERSRQARFLPSCQPVLGDRNP